VVLVMVYKATKNPSPVVGAGDGVAAAVALLLSEGSVTFLSQEAKKSEVDNNAKVSFFIL
jgi:hypothetical protein